MSDFYIILLMILLCFPISIFTAYLDDYDIKSEIINYLIFGFFLIFTVIFKNFHKYLRNY